jgi:hypothetical protein
MSMKRTPEWYAEHQAKMQRISNIELVELVPAQKFGQPPEVKPKRTPVVSPKERYPHLLVMFAERGIYPPVTEYVFSGQRGFRMDYAWPPKKVALEVDGGIWRGYGKGSKAEKAGAHSHPTAILRDIEKHNLATMLGWRVIRATPDKFDEAVRAIELLLMSEAA